MWNDDFCLTLQLSKLEQAVDDCTKAIELDENYVKAYARRAATWVYMMLCVVTCLILYGWFTVSAL